MIPVPNFLKSSDNDEGYFMLSCDSLGGLFVSSNGLLGDGNCNTEACKTQLLQRDDDGSLGTFMNRYTSVRRFANETNLIVSTNFVKRYTFDEVDVSNVLQDLLKSS